MDRANICGVRVHQARTQHKLQQIELSAALEVECGVKISQSDVSEIERGVRGVKDYELDALARVLSVSPSWLLRGQE
ncbi:MAG: helix-turn-helix domain-containing protein [Alphaproteobacteria bacterium]